MSQTRPPIPGSAPPQSPGLVLIQPGDSGNAVRVIQSRLAALGFHQALVDGQYGPVTQRAIAAFQRSRNLQPTGLIDLATLNALGYAVDDAPHQQQPQPGLPAGVSVEAVASLFPDAPVQNIRNYLPMILRALGEQGLADKAMLLMALATIKAETANFAPISEHQSKYNTEPGGRPFGKYDFRSDLGNGAPGDGDRYKGRGFVQLTGKHNYTTYSVRLGMGNLLVERPELANDPIIAARILATFLKSKEMTIRLALERNDFAAARKAVNGGTHGLDAFKLAFQKGNDVLA